MIRRHPAPKATCRAAPPPTKPEGTPQPKAQGNFTDPESRIVLRDGCFVQAYNAQIGVDEGHQIIVAAALSNQAPDADARRKATAEPVFGQICRGIRQLSFRGLFKNRCEWLLICATTIFSSSGGLSAAVPSRYRPRQLPDNHRPHPNSLPRLSLR